MSENVPVETTGEPEYGADAIKVLTGLAPVRRRPGMYIGDTQDGSGLHNMLFAWAEQFAIEDARASGSFRVDLTLNANGSVTVEHDGFGLPIVPFRDGGTEAEALMTRITCGQFPHDGVDYGGLAIVNALSSQLELTIWNGGKEYSLAYEKGEPLYPLDLVGSSCGKSGVRVTFLPCPEIFATTAFDYDTLEERFRELAFFYPGVSITLRDRRGSRSRSAVLHSDHGLADFLRYLDRTNEPVLAGPLFVHGSDGVTYPHDIRDTITVDAALHWNAGRQQTIVCFTNRVRQHLGGTHLGGVQAAIRRTFHGTPKIKSTPVATGDACEGLVCVLTVKTGHWPEFADSTRDKLASPEIGTAVESIMAAALTAWFEDHPAEAERIAGKLLEQ